MPISPTSAAYSGFGLDIVSQLPLPELEPRVDGSDGDDVHIGLGQVDAPGEGIVQIEPDLFRLKIDGVGRFEVRDGRSITVAPDPDATQTELRAYLLGTVLGALFQQRGLLALHASAVAAAGNKAVLFLGESGAGKSTLAMALNSRGYGLLCDDLCVVAQDSQGMPQTWPGVRRLKLWSRSIEAAGGTTSGLEPVLQREDKFHVPTSMIAPYRPHRVSSLYLLEKGESDAVSIVPLSGVNALQGVMSHTFRGRMVAVMGTSERHLRSCVNLLDRCRVYRITRPWNLDRLDQATDAIAQHLDREAESSS